MKWKGKPSTSYYDHLYDVISEQYRGKFARDDARTEKDDLMLGSTLINLAKNDFFTDST